MTNDWLLPLIADSLGDFELTPELDRDLSRRALRARHDPAERDELLRLLSLKLRRFCSRFRRWHLDPWEFDDVVQEAYLVFADLLDAWTPLPGPSGFVPYLLRVFPLRLADHVNAMVATRRDRPASVPYDPRTDLRLDPARMERDIETAAFIAAVAAGLPSAEAVLFRLRATGDDPFRHDARRAGLSLRTAWRRWPEIQRAAREAG